MRRLLGFVPLMAVSVLAVAAAVVGVVESPSPRRISSASTSTSTRPAAPTTTVPSTTSTTLPPPSSEPVTPTSAPLPAGSSLTACTFTQLAVSEGDLGTGAGHWGRRVSFRNAGTTTCTLYGYPGVALLNAAGHEVAQALRTPDGFIGGMKTGSSVPPTAILAPGQTGTAVIEGIDIVGINGTTSCPTYSGIVVTPPTTTESVHFPLSVVGCLAVQVHPVIATTRSTITPGATVSHPTVTQLTVVGMTVPAAAALTLFTDRHLEIQLTGEQVVASVVPDTIISQGAPGGSLTTSPTYPVLVDVTVAMPPAPPCRATQLAVAFLGGQGFGGNDSGFLVVRDTSPQWCSFTGPVGVWGRADTGRIVTQKLTVPVPAPVVMSPRTETPEPFISATSPGVVQASVEFAANENACIPPYPTSPTPTVRVVPATLVLSMPGGFTLSAQNDSYSKEGLPQFIACHGRFLTQQMPTAVTVRG